MADSLEGISVRPIDVLTIRGKDVLASCTTDHKLEFTLHRQLSRTVISFDQSAIGIVAFSPDSFRLLGVLADERPIFIDQLRRIGAKEGGLVELRPWNCAVEIGYRGAGAPLGSAFILTGLYEGDFNLNYGEWRVDLTSEKNARSNIKASKGLGIPLEGLTLRISSKGKSYEQHEIMAADIMLLLSLASGTGVTCHRWIFDYSDNKRIEFWRSRAGEEIGPGPIVEPWCLFTFIEQVIPVWHHMPEAERKIIRTAISHLNISGSGYLENRLFQTAQT